MLRAEHSLFRILTSQLKSNCTYFEAGRELSQTPDEAAEFDKAIEDSRSVIARVEEMLKKIDKKDLIDED